MGALLIGESVVLPKALLILLFRTQRAPCSPSGSFPRGGSENILTT